MRVEESRSTRLGWLHLATWTLNRSRITGAHRETWYRSRWRASAQEPPPPAAVHGTAATPARAARQPMARLFVCQNTTCAGQGAQQTLETLRALAEACAAEVPLEVVPTGCLGGCGSGPNVLVLRGTDRDERAGTAAVKPKKLWKQGSVVGSPHVLVERGVHRVEDALRVLDDAVPGTGLFHLRPAHVQNTTGRTVAALIEAMRWKERGNEYAEPMLCESPTWRLRTAPQQAAQQALTAYDNALTALVRADAASDELARPPSDAVPPPRERLRAAIHANISLVYWRLRRYDEALTAANAAVDANRMSSVAWLRKADAHAARYRQTLASPYEDDGGRELDDGAMAVRSYRIAMRLDRSSEESVRARMQHHLAGTRYASESNAAE
eukprot:ctg_747.g396